jgi:MFS superfamily sulfate permease-like transporter
MSTTYFRFDFLKQDLAAGFVVFLVALPLCLGIALASEAPLLSGVISGVVAGLLVSLISGSELSVSGPAAGLTATVIAGQLAIGSFEGLLVATTLSGFIQILLGAIRSGHLASLFPASVIKGMLAGIGVIIILKQLPYAFGWTGDFDLEDGLSTMFTFQNSHLILKASIGAISFGSLIISLVGAIVLIEWHNRAQRGGAFFKSFPGALAAVIVGVLLNQAFHQWLPHLEISRESGQLVALPALSSPADILSLMPSDWSLWIQNKSVWAVALAIAMVGSVETLLCVEATDKLDPLRRISRPNRELVAQGIGNAVSGALGGLPLTSVIVRSSANIYAGARTRISAFVHGSLLLLCVAFLPGLLNSIPLASLATVLIFVGYKLCNFSVFRQMRESGFDQFVPFVVTLLSVVFLDLLSGVAIGTMAGLFFVLKMNYHAAFTAVHEDDFYLIRFNKDVNFIQKVALKKTLARIPDYSSVLIDGGSVMFIDYDILELLHDFKRSVADRHITVTYRNFISARNRAALEETAPA